MKKFKLIAAAFLVIVFSVISMTACHNNENEKPQNAAGLVYPEVNPEDDILERLENSQTIYVIKPSMRGITGKAMTSAEKMLLQSLQGIVAQRQAEIYLGSASDKFLKYAKIKYNLTLDDGKYVYYVDENGEEQKRDSDTAWLENLGTLINHYVETGDIQGYVKLKYEEGRYNELENQSNQASTLAGVYRYIMVAESVEEDLNSVCPDVKCGRDISTTNITQYEIFKECEDLINKNVLIMQAAPRVENLREYGIAVKAGFYFYNEGDPEEERDYVYSSLNDMANAFGWEQIDTVEDGVKIGMTEDPSVDFASKRNVNVFAADWCSNLSVWMSMPVEKVEQVDYRKLSTDEEQVHYVTMLMSDGDNIQWTTGTGFTNDFFLGTKADKKEMPFGWTLTASMAEVAPSTLSYIYENMIDIENFVCSVSGYAYSHPAHFTDEALALFARNTAVMMGKADMSLIAMKGVNEKVMNAFSDQEEIEGGFVMYGCDSGRGGEIYWANGKPFVHDRYIFWKDSGESRDPEYIAKRIVQLRDLSTDKTQSSCYSFIQVHCWSYKYADVVKLFYNNISDSDNIKVVTPAEMIDLIKANVEPADKGYTK